MSNNNCEAWCQDSTGHASEATPEDMICYRYSEELALSTDPVVLESNGVHRSVIEASLWGADDGPVIELSYRGATSGRMTLAEAATLHSELGKLLAAAQG